MYVYVASSWRNPKQPHVVDTIRRAGFEAYDFRNPRPGSHGFSWRDVGGPADDERRGPLPKGADHVPPAQYLEMVNHPVAVEGFRSDFDAMRAADAFVLVLPCGKSAHLELGWAAGAGVPTAILLEDPMEPELMYRMTSLLAPELRDVVTWLERLDHDRRARVIPDVAGRDLGLYGGLR